MWVWVFLIIPNSNTKQGTFSRVARLSCLALSLRQTAKDKIVLDSRVPMVGERASNLIRVRWQQGDKHDLRGGFLRWLSIF